MELSSANSVKAYRGSYQWKAAALFFVVFTDLIITCFADHYHNAQHDIWYPFALLGVQFLIQIIVFLLMFMMFLSTYLFQVGLLENLQREFRPILITLPVYFLIFVTYFAVKVVLILDDKPWSRLWEEGEFVAVSLVHKAAAVVYWSVIIASTLKFGELRWYLRSAWVRHYQQSQADPGAGIANVV